MCMEDIRVMRRSRTDQRNVIVLTTPTLIVPRSDYRVSLMIAAPQQISAFHGTVNLITGDILFNISALDPIFLSRQPSMPVDQLFNFWAFGTPLILNIQQHGTIVTDGLWAKSISGNIRIGIFETFLDEK